MVCAAGFLEDGSWIRIYPVQFRKKDYGEQYSKYQWIDVDLIKNKRDFRPESFRPVTHESPIEITGKIPSDSDTWEERRKIVLENVCYNITDLIAEAKDKDNVLPWLFLSQKKYWILFTRNKRKENGLLLSWHNFNN